ncbi:amidohydrolase family protein [Flavihumibacter cheonanensis]|uniref:amidohydrolase family protein n=1 Tax=Flavihumibacter cheonanensis TaxID=1442385 RepID=UPI001EF9633C|nr:amidohydrolase family protein [Flavihumibacter cheonanensis]MCG7752873.1 amidohydrolase family protein [Flavihumibacter cheonanensis]
MLKIDAHHHIWEYDPVQHAWIDDSMAVIQRSFTPADMEPLLQEAGIDGTVLVQVNQNLRENMVFTSAAEANPFIKGVVGWVDLLAADLEDQLDELRDLPKLKGFRHIAQAEPADYLSRSEVVRGIRQLGKYGFTYDILIKPHQMEAAVELVKICPAQPFVLDHIAKPYIKSGEIDAWRKLMYTLGAMDNCYCKISGIITEADWHSWTPEQIRPYLDVALEAFGSRRLMFGSDWPVCLVAGSYRDVVNLAADYVQNLSVQEQQDFWGGNATRFYGL